MAALAASAPASADADTPFATLDRVGRHSTVGAQLSFGVIDAEGVDGFVRFDLHGQFDVAPRLSIYSAIAISQGFTELDDELGLSNLDLGIHYRVSAGRRAKLVVRGGLLLPTASDDGDAFFSNLLGSFTRVTDTAMIVPDSTWARLSLNYLYTGRRVFLQGDFGVDIAIVADGDNPDPLLHFNGGLGITLSGATLAFELANVVFTEGEDNWDTTFSTVVRFGGSHVQPYAGVILPLDEDLDVFVFTVGIAGPL